jgi:hypothetical protein
MEIHLSNDFYLMIKFLEPFIKTNNIIFFFQNISKLKNRIYKDVLANKDFNKKVTITSGEALNIFGCIPFFFRNYFEKNYNHLKSFLLRKKYIEKIMKNNICYGELDL